VNLLYRLQALEQKQEREQESYRREEKLMLSAMYEVCFTYISY
jgi:hypothetical protein